MNEHEPSQPVSTEFPPDEAAAALSQRMSEIAKLPRRPRGTVKASLPKGLPKWVQQLDDELQRLRKNGHLVKARAALQAELTAAGLTPTPAQVEHTVRCGVLVEFCDAALFSLYGGPVNRHKRSLHALTQQRADLLATYLSMRQRLGLDRALVSEDGDFAEQLAAARGRSADRTFLAGVIDAAGAGTGEDSGYYASVVDRLITARLRAAGIVEGSDLWQQLIKEPAAPPTPAPLALPAPPEMAVGKAGASAGPAFDEDAELLPPETPAPRAARDVTPARDPREAPPLSNRQPDMTGIDPNSHLDPNAEWRAWHSRLGTNPKFEGG